MEPETTSHSEEQARTLADDVRAEGVVSSEALRGPSCQSCGATTSESLGAHVYAIGRIECRFPTLGTEKEFRQHAARSDTKGLTDLQVLRKVLGARDARYLVRQICWMLTIEGLPTYVLRPRDPGDYELLVETLRPATKPTDLDLVIGMRGPIAPPEFCNGLTVPIVMFDQIYSFDRDALIETIPRPENMPAKTFEPAAGELFDRMMQMCDNAGGTDEDRALNYLSLRYPAIYGTTAEAYAHGSSLTSVTVRPSSLSVTRKIVDVIFSYTNRSTDVVEQWFVRVDVTERFPFLVTKMSPFFDRIAAQ
jgi:hypothetical protein